MAPAGGGEVGAVSLFLSAAPSMAPRSRPSDPASWPPPRLLPHGPSSFHLSNPASPSCPGPRHVLSPRREPRPGACLRQRRLHPARSRLLCPSSRPPSRRHCLKLNGLPVYGPFFSTRTEALLACSCYISRVSTVTVTEQGLSPYRVGERGNRRPG